MAGGSVTATAARAYFYVVIWMAISMAVILFNKWLLAYSGFPFPLALTMWHMFFCSSIAFVFVRVLKVVKSVNMPRRDYLRKVMPIGLLYAASLWLSNSAYLHLSVSFIQMTKALMPGLVYGTGVIMGTEVLTQVNVLIMTLIAIGVAVAAYGEVNFVVIGVIEQLSALVFEATRLVLVQVLMSSQGYVLNPIQSLYYVSPACFVCLTVPFLVLEYPLMTDRSSWLFRPWHMVANASAAFLLNLAVFLLIGKTSALTMNIAGVIKDWMLIWMSMKMFTAPVTALNLIGYTVAFAGVCWYNYVKLKSIKTKATVAAKDEEQPPVDGAKDTKASQ